MIFNKKVIICDCCGTELHKRDVYTNDGKYQADYIEKGDITICFHCGGKMLDIFIKSDLTEEKLREMITEFSIKLDPHSPLTQLADIKDLGFFK